MKNLLLLWSLWFICLNLFNMENAAWHSLFVTYAVYWLDRMWRWVAEVDDSAKALDREYKIDLPEDPYAK